jgi:class 3 adenylate cyclase/tetratricopeptide (TPR) repeat protein
MKEYRKLAAIMFTDIVGYSAIMSKDEKQAMNILEKNREIHKSAIERFNGEYIKEIGDGTLSIFQSSFDAVNCAIEIQKACCKESSLLVRIGIHIGDIILKDDDVFGDGVNIASRIEAAGEPSGIYISGRVYEDIKNKTEIHAEFIGERTFKNIDHPLKVYALREGGLTSSQKPIPKSTRFSRLKKRKYAVIVGVVCICTILTLLIINLINQKDSLNLNKNLIAVAVFENQTGDESLDPVGRMTSDWITQGIASTGLVSVMPSFKLKTITEIHQNMDGIRSVAEETTAQTIITGVFYKEGNNLQFHAHIVNARDGEILNAVGPISGPDDNPLKSIEQLRQKIMGALAAIFDKKFKNYSDRTLNPPLFEAYREFLLGVDLFFNYEYEQAIHHFYLAAYIDTNYYLPLLWVNGAYLNCQEYRKMDSLCQILEKHRTYLSVGEQHHLEWLIAILQGDLEGAYKAACNAASFYLIFEYQKALDALNANRPLNSIEALSELEPDLLHFPGWYWEVLAQAYHICGNFKEELATAERGREKHPTLFSAYWNELKALAALGKIEKINQLIAESLNLSKSEDWTPGTPGWLMLITAQELRAHGYPEEAKKVIERSIEWYNTHSADEYRYDLASAYYVAERWDESQKLFELLVEEEPEKIEYLGYLGAIAARNGKFEEAKRISMFIADLDLPYLFGEDSYWRARIAAAIGNKELSVQLLRKAIAQGIPRNERITQVSRHHVHRHHRVFGYDVER